MKNAWALAYGLVCGLLVAGLLYLATRPVRGQPVILIPPPTPEPFQIHVAGAVIDPGVYAVPGGSRVQDAIQAAGGFTAQANPDGVNLAAILTDGQRVVVPTIAPTPALDASRSGSFPTPAVAFPLDINQATAAELEALPEIGPVTAERIVAYRTEHGPFRTIEELDNVPEIGEATLSKIKDLITVGP